MIKDGVDYLFHYTTIEKLALILKNKTIRLNALCNMDDLQEGRSKDLQKIGRFFFVSSWTDEEEESIPMPNCTNRGRIKQIAENLNKRIEVVKINGVLKKLQEIFRPYSDVFSSMGLMHVQ